MGTIDAGGRGGKVGFVEHAGPVADVDEIDEQASAVDEEERVDSVAQAMKTFDGGELAAIRNGFGGRHGRFMAEVRMTPRSGGE